MNGFGPPRHVAIVGPTASGKSALAHALARALGDAQIVSLDSMQVYRGMDVGTAKPTTHERNEVRHHLIDVADPWEDWSVARTQTQARAAVAEIEQQGGRAVLVGGTGLYVQAVVDDLTIPGEDLAVRAELEAATSEPGGVRDAYAELQRLDPTAASRIDEHNQRRIVRALEVIRVTGRPFSSFGPGVFGTTASALSVAMFGVWLPRPVLAGRIEARVVAMRAQGLVAEVQRLAGAPRPLSRSARQAIGYKELLDVIDGSQAAAPAAHDWDQAFDLIVRRTRSFARRQRMWFRRDPRITWLAHRHDPEALLPALLAAAAPRSEVLR